MAETIPTRLPAVISPVLEGTEDEQSWLDEVPTEALAAGAAAGAAADAVVFGVCVVVLAASPGNCTALCGLTVVTLFVSPEDSVVVTVARLPDGRIDEAGTLNGSETTVPGDTACVAVDVAGAKPVVTEADGNTGPVSATP